MKMRWMFALLYAFGMAVSLAEEPSPLLGDRPDPSEEVIAMGDEFFSEAGGISLRVPAGMELLRRGSADEIAQFTHEERKWSLQVSRRTLADPRPLTSGRDAEGRQVEGFLENTLAQLLIDYPRAQIIREDALTVGDHDAAVLAARVTLGTQRHLLQQAIIQANPRLYDLLTMSTPTEVLADSDETTVDPRERLAVHAFMQSLESVTLTDLTGIREDQDRRLLATRAFLETLTPEKLKNVLIEEQWLRILKGGRDIGYTYIVEETDKIGTRDSIILLLRTRTMPETGKQVDASLRIDLSGDRRHESWSAVEVVTDGDRRDHASEVGASDLSVRRVLDRSQYVAGGIDPKQPPMREEETYTLKVTHMSKSATAPPVSRELPPFYLTQAMEHLLSRLIPLDKPAGYLFASYIGSMRQVMLRYVDVGNPEEVRLGEQRVSAIPIRHRIGLEGSTTLHYVSPEGKFMGTVSPESRITILPTDAATLQSIWKDADLSRPNPDAVQKPQE